MIPLLSVDTATLQYQTADHLITATWRVSFDVQEGDRFVLLGPSGCGKSSLLKAIGGFVEPVVDVRGRLESLVVGIDEADERGDDDLRALVGGQRVPVRGDQRHGPPEPADPGLDRVVRRLALGWLERRAVVADTLGLEPEQAPVDPRAEHVEQDADRTEHRLDLCGVVEDRLRIPSQDGQ